MSFWLFPLRVKRLYIRNSHKIFLPKTYLSSQDFNTIYHSIIINDFQKNTKMNKLVTLLTIALVACLVASNANAAAELNDGVYDYVKDHDTNFEDVLSCMGVGFLTRKMANVASPKIVVEAKDDGTISLKTTTTFSTSLMVFKLGVEFDEKRLDGVMAKSTITKDGNKLIQKQRVEGMPEVTITREFVEDKMITTCECKDLKSVREYKKL